jgi:hypothetical protein
MFLGHYFYKVFAHFLTARLDVSPVSYTTFFSIFLGKDLSISNIWRLPWQFAARRCLDSRISTAFVIAGLMFVEWWPTIASAMAGYVPSNRAYMRDSDGNMVSLSNLMHLAHNAHDGLRVGYPSNH